MLGKDLNAAADKQSEKQEIDVVRQTQPERETEVRNVMIHGLETDALVGRKFSTGSNRARLADGFFAVLGKDSGG